MSSCVLVCCLSKVQPLKIPWLKLPAFNFKIHMDLAPELLHLGDVFLLLLEVAVKDRIGQGCPVHRFTVMWIELM